MLVVPEIFNELNAIPRNWQVPSREITRNGKQHFPSFCSA